MSCVFDSIGRQFSHYFFRSEYFSRCLMASVAFNIRSVIFRALKTVGKLPNGSNGCSRSENSLKGQLSQLCHEK